MEEKEVQEPVKDAKRRTLLKAAAVAGGAVAAGALLPGTWTRPLATVGGLPAHAQMSDGTIQLDQRSVSIVRRVTTPPGAQISEMRASVDYKDFLCGVDDTATLWVQLNPCGDVKFNHVKFGNLPPAADFARVGDGCEGTIKFDFWPTCNCTGDIGVQIGTGGRFSNIVNGTFDCSPPPA